jgi:hypothetical protein
MKKMIVLAFLTTASVSGCSSLNFSLPEKEYKPAVMPTFVDVPKNRQYTIHSDSAGNIYVTFNLGSASSIKVTKFSFSHQKNNCELVMSSPVKLVPGYATIKAFERTQLIDCVPALDGYSQVDTSISKPQGVSYWRSIAAAAMVEWEAGPVVYQKSDATPFFFYNPAS